jgi:hypothetical protein
LLSSRPSMMWSRRTCDRDKLLEIPN